MKKWLVVMGVSLMLCGTAEAGIGDAVKNVWSYVTSFLTCGIARAGALVDWAIDSGTCALQTVNRNPITLQPLLPLPTPSTSEVSHVETPH